MFLEYDRSLIFNIKDLCSNINVSSKSKEGLNIEQ
jgi:hypothetical protein